MPGMPIDPNKDPNQFWLSKALRNATSLDTPQDQGLGQDVAEFGAGFIPGVGQAMAVRDFERARRADDYLGMGLSAASLVPGGSLLKALRGGRQELIAGRHADRAPHRLMDEAEQMSREGFSPQAQWDSTGRRAYVGPDRQAKWEIDDSPSRLLHKEGAIPFHEAKTMGELLHHPELYANYPGAKNITVIGGIDPTHTGGGSFSGAKNAKDYDLIEANSRNPLEFKQTLLHELQHYIQSREPKFSTGANDDTILAAMVRGYQSKHGGAAPGGITYEQLKSDAMQDYLHNMGEAEARAVERRWTKGLRDPVPSAYHDVDPDQLWHESTRKY